MVVEPAAFSKNSSPSAPGPSRRSTAPRPTSPTNCISQFVNLPTDIHHLILTRHLPFDSVLALRQTCTFFHHLLTPARVERIRTSIIARLIADEQRRMRDWIASIPYYDKWFARYHRPTEELHCYTCLELLPIAAFTESQASRGLALGAKYAAQRWCKACGLQRGRIQPGFWYRENWFDGSNANSTSGGDCSLATVWRSDLISSLWAGSGRTNGQCGRCWRCLRTPFELYWGCVDCFEKEQKRRQGVDREGLGWARKSAVAVAEKLHACKAAWRKAKRGKKFTGLQWNPRKWELVGLGTWIESKKARRARRRDAETQSPEDEQNEVDQQPTAMNWKPVRPNHEEALVKDRREVRCTLCWVPNCPRRRYVLGLAYERPLKKEYWCDRCTAEDDRSSHVRKAKKTQSAKSWWNFEDPVTLEDMGIGTLWA